jgi:hypothetical protein
MVTGPRHEESDRRVTGDRPQAVNRTFPSHVLHPPNQRLPDPASLKLGLDGQMADKDIRGATLDANQTADDPFTDARDQCALDTHRRERERSAAVARQAERLPQYGPQQFIQRGCFPG